MSDRKTHPEPSDTPEDVATLYSWANLHGAKYRDFSASRALTREKARQRVQDAIAVEKERAREEAGGERVSDAQLAEEASRAAEASRTAEATREAQLAREAAEQNRWQPPVLERPAPQAANHPLPAPANPSSASSGEFRGYSAFNALRTTSPPTPQRNAPREEPPAYTPRITAPPFPPAAPQDPQAYSPQGYSPRTTAPPSPRRTQPPAQDPGPDFGRPAWLTQPRQEPGSPPVPQAPPDTLQGSRDRLTSRWFALKGVFETPATPLVEPAQSSMASRVPVTAVFSLAGGVGKTSLVATLARALSARGERLLLVDTSSFGMLPFFFGARDQRPGVLRTFSPPGGGGDAPIQTVSIDPDSLESETVNPDTLGQEIFRQAKSANRVLVDVATASGSITRRILRIAPVVLVPVIPDMTSVVSVGAIDGFFRQHPSPTGRQVQPFYLLNQFDHTLPLHLDVREVLREQLGDRLLPFVMRRSPTVSEALAEGMTVMDYAPGSPLAEDFTSLANWIKNIAAPVSSSYRGVRWSER